MQRDIEIAFKRQTCFHTDKLKREKIRYEKTIVKGDLSKLAHTPLRLLFMMVNKMQLLTKGLHVLWRVRVFTKEVCIFCNDDNSEETLHEVICTEVTMMIGRSDFNHWMSKMPEL